jgi:3-hydroxyacyl-CoA dehydrogenase
MQTNKAVNLIGIVGAGAMGSGIAQIASQAGHEVVLFDLSRSLNLQFFQASKSNESTD